MVALSVVLTPVGFLVGPVMVRGAMEQPLTGRFFVAGLIALATRRAAQPTSLAASWASGQ